MRTLDRSRPAIAAQAVGIAQGALEVAAAYARDRKQFGQRIGDFQQVGAMLADMDAGTEAARQLLYKACVEIDAGAPDASRWSAMCKLVAGDTAMRVTTDAVQVLGRLRLHRRVPGRADDARREDHPALRGDPADPAPRHRAIPARQGLTAASAQEVPSARAHRRPHETRPGSRLGRRTTRSRWPAGPGRQPGRRQRQRRVRPREGAQAHRGGRRGRGHPADDGPGDGARDDAQGARDGCDARRPRDGPGARGLRHRGDDPRPGGGARRRSSSTSCSPASTRPTAWPASWRPGSPR